MSCDSRKLTSRRLIADHSMASGPPSHNEIPKYMFGIAPNTPGTPIRGTASTLLTPWQQTYTPTAPYNTPAAHTPSHFTTLISSTTGIFQYNSAPPSPKSQTKKHLNNENPDTPAPTRVQKLVVVLHHGPTHY